MHTYIHPHLDTSINEYMHTGTHTYAVYTHKRLDQHTQVVTILQRRTYSKITLVRIITVMIITMIITATIRPPYDSQKQLNTHITDFT